MTSEFVAKGQYGNNAEHEKEKKLAMLV